MQYNEYKDYAVIVARRFVNYRRSAMIDEGDLVNTAMIRLWETEQEKGKLEDKVAKRIVRLAMLDAVRSSSIVRTPRNMKMKQAIQAYQQINTMNASEEPRSYPVDDWVEDEPVRQVQAIVDSLPKEERLILSLIWEQSCSLQDAADVLEVSKATVHRRYQQILKKIKSRLLKHKQSLK